MNRLLLLNEDLVQQASRTTVKPAAPVQSLKPSLPIRPIQQWEKSEKMMEKTFEFPDSTTRTHFLFQVLGMEEEKGHHADMVLREKSVKVRLTTRDVNKVTELDREYASSADSIYSELMVKNDV